MLKASNPWKIINLKTLNPKDLNKAYKCKEPNNSKENLIYSKALTPRKALSSKIKILKP